MNRRTAAWLVVFGGLLAIPVLLFDPSRTFVTKRFLTFLTFAALATALNIIFGETDQLYLFTGGLAAIGAYTTALSADYLGVSPWLTLVAGAIAAGSLGALVSYVAARRRFTVIVLAILTFAFQSIIMELLVGLRDITGGSTGFRFTALQIEPVQAALGISRYTVAYYALVGVFALAVGSYSWLVRSKYGLAFEAIRQDEIAAEATGIDIVRQQAFAGFVGASLIGLVGPFYAQSTGLVIPSLFSFASVDVLVLIVVVLGGLRTTFGPLAGAAVVTYLYDVLSEFGQWRTVAFGLLLTFLFIYFRQGILPAVTSLVEEPRAVWDRLRSPRR
ncbi:MAG: branched-chain amino acid ABC transporter permease [Halobacteriales archaeon]